MRLTPIQRLSLLGKLCIGFIATVCGLVQIPQVKDTLIPLLANHPHCSTVLGGVTLIGALMANPQVQQVLGIEETKKTSVADADGTLMTLVETKTTTVDSAK